MVVRRTPTSIKIDEELWLEFKIAALRKKITASELLEELMHQFLNREKKIK